MNHQDTPVPSTVPGKGPPPTPPPRVNSIPAEPVRDVLYIEHDDDGLEIFHVSEARCNLRNTDGVWEFTIGCRGVEPVQRSENLAEVIQPEPHFEATALLADNDLDLKAGRVILQKIGYDRKRETNLSNYYYFDHNSVEDVRIELLEVTSELILARFSGCSPVGDAKLTVLTRFKRDSSFGRGIQ